MPEAAPVVVAPELEGKQPTPAAAVAQVEVKIGDKTVKVDAATAEALKAYTDAQDAARVATKAQLDELARKVAGLQAPTQKQDAEAEPDIDQLLFTDPKRALQLHEESILSKINSQVARTNAQQEFWAEFYKQNPELSDADFLVKSVMTREYGTLKSLQVPEAIKKLAETVKGDIMKLTKKPAKTEKADPAEGGNEKLPAASKESDANDKSVPTSLTDVLKQRRAARAKGRAAA